MKPKLLLGLALVLSGGLFGWPNILRAQTSSNLAYQVELSLRATSERGRGGQTFEIFAKNISTNEVEIASKSATTQQWSVYWWFKWQIDGKEALFGESIANIPKKMETWLIPPGGEIRWAVISTYSFGDGSWIKDSKLHNVTISPSDKWGNLKVKGATITTPGRDADSTAPIPLSASAPESKYATYDWRPMLKTSDWHDLAMKLKQSKVPTEAEAQILASPSLPRPMDARDVLVVSALFQLARNDAELGNADDLIWEVREISARHGEEISGLAWVDAFTGKVKVLYPK